METAGREPVWDIGCGPGQTVKYLKELGVKISGLDLSEKMLEQARTANPGVEFRKGNMLDLEFQERSVAAALSFYSIVHFSETQAQKAFDEIYRVLKVGGIFLLAFHIGEETLHVDELFEEKIDVDFMYFSTDFIFKALQKSGFGKIELFERDPYEGVEYPSRRAYVFSVKESS